MNYAELKNDDGYMVDPAQWTREYAEWRAEDLGIEMTDEHWKIVDLFREFIVEHAITPSSRIAQKEAKKRFGYDSKGFYTLFSKRAETGFHGGGGDQAFGLLNPPRPRPIKAPSLRGLFSCAEDQHHGARPSGRALKRSCTGGGRATARPQGRAPNV